MSSIKYFTPIFAALKRFWAVGILLAILSLLFSCSSTRLLLHTAPSKPKGAPAMPTLNISTQNTWEQVQKPAIQNLLETHIYGQWPQNLDITKIDSHMLTGSYFADSALISIDTLNIKALKTAQDRTFGLVLLQPHTMTANGTVIMMESFCPNHDVIPVPGIPKPNSPYFNCSETSIMASVFLYVFGRYIVTPPISDIMARGYTLAIIYPPEYVPDNFTGARAILNKLFSDQANTHKTHAIMAWAHQFSLLSKYLKSQYGFTQSIAYGHSRYGKAALLAAAFDPHIDGVIAHQSGTAGASLFKDKTGESITQIMEGYPHWFHPRLADYAKTPESLPFDQHHLLAIIAPRPVLLGNARRDVWSNPNGAFRAAQAASQAYQLYGIRGLTQNRLTDFNPQDTLAFWMRPGTHGIVKEDWPAFLAFLDQHFQTIK